MISGDYGAICSPCAQLREGRDLCNNTEPLANFRKGRALVCTHDVVCSGRHQSHISTARQSLLDLK